MAEIQEDWQFILSHVGVSIHGVWIGDSIYWPFKTQLVATLNYSAIANLHVLQITRAFRLVFSTVCTVRFLVTASNNGDSSAASLTLLPAGHHLTTEQNSKSKSNSELLHDWRFTANQFVFAPSPLRLTTRDCFNRTFAVIVLSDEKMGLSVMNILALSPSVHFAHIACYWKFLLLHYTQVLCQSRLCKGDHAYLPYLILQRQLSHLNGRKLSHRQI
jgi:hypothetical protein